MRLKILHSTHYRFDTPVKYGLQQLRKTPKSSPQQQIISWRTRVKNGRKELEFEDYHHNTTELISFAPDTTELSVISEGEVALSDTHGVLGAHRGPAPLWLYQRETERTRAGKGARALLRGIEAAAPTLEGLHALAAGIRAAVPYEIGASYPDWSAEDALDAGRGVCQDHAHIFLACARELGAPARYVSGYLMLDDKTVQEAMHAWSEVHIEGLGWVGFDVSNGISPDTRYVRVATGLDYGDASPVSGSRVGGTGETLEVQIDVAQQ
ncbi:MAG: transglutaminase family protein [Pseudomonadota bacterium]|uniref:transglutaminase family protein n=1 Tax=Roseovarius sp. TaxID=1486281 RepID=UPI0035616F71